MKKKKKPTKKAVKVTKEASPFWRQAYAFLLILVAFFVLLGGVGLGGPLPRDWLFPAMSWLFGYAAYFVPIVLVYLAVIKLKNENHIIPFSKLLSSTMMLSLIAAVLHVFVAKDTAAQMARDGSYGGEIGYVINVMALSVLSSGTAFVLYLVLLLIAVLFTYGITPKSFVGWLIRLLRRKEVDTDLAAMKAKGEHHRFELRENVPVEHHDESPREASKLSSFKNSAQKLSAAEDHSALTIASDPNWKFPDIDLLNQKQDKADAGDVQGNAEIIRQTFANFNIQVEMEGANVGPRVTQYTLKPPNGVKLSKIAALDKDLALPLAATSIRIEAPIPGKSAVGIEVPNVRPATVRVSSLLQSRDWRELKTPLAFAVGKDISGQSVVASIAKMPHMLIAGQTGSGKSVMINTLLTSLLFRNSPSELKLILVDPKQVELTPYNDIPHLLTPVITEPEKCISALKWAVAEMERRLRTFAEHSKRSIAEYNALESEQNMPYIVIVIDELADLMMMAARDVEGLIVRIAQKARAAGIHLVLATQRPSVDVITGLIKANVPARIAFTVASQVDSRTILDQIGAEKLLGMGDMLFHTTDMAKPKRLQGALITDEETIKVCDFLRMQQAPSYDDEVVSQPVQLNGRGGVVAEIHGSDVDDPMWKDAVTVVVESGKASTSYLQRRLRLGYSRAARIIETMEEHGIVGPANGSQPREVLVHSVAEALGGGGSGEVYDDMPDDPSDD